MATDTTNTTEKQYRIGRYRRDEVTGEIVFEGFTDGWGQMLLQADRAAVLVNALNRDDSPTFVRRPGVFYELIAEDVNPYAI